MALGVALACPACATSGLPPPDRPVDTEVARTVRTVRGGKTVGRVEQHGSEVTVVATRTCDLEKVRVVERTMSVTSRELPVGLTGPTIIGTYLCVVGIPMAGVALSVTYSHSLRDAAIGGAMTGVGAVLIALGFIVSTKPAKGVSVTRLDLGDGLLQEGVPCRDVPNAAAHEPVTGRAGALEVPFGDTDAAGALKIELSTALPPSLLRDAAPGATLRLFVREVEVGSARLDEVSAAATERARAAREQVTAEAARRDAAAACRRTCQETCQRDAACASACVARSCP
jgi:hypothetical protein